MNSWVALEPKSNVCELESQGPGLTVRRWSIFDDLPRILSNLCSRMDKPCVRDKKGMYKLVLKKVPSPTVIGQVMYICSLAAC